MAIAGIFQDICEVRRQYFIKKVKAPLMSGLLNLVGLKWKNEAGKPIKLTCPRIIEYLLIFISLLKIAITIKRYPEPTKENCQQHNARVLLDIWDEFFKYENPHTSVRIPLFLAIRKILLGEVEHDHYYRDRIYWFVEELVKAYLDDRWHPQIPVRPDRRCSWREPLDTDTMITWLEFLRYRNKL